MTEYKELAQKRADQLWEFYHQNGDRITKADVRRIMGRNWNNIYLTFRTHKVEAPPVYDSREEKRRRQAETLKSLACKKGRDWLTTDEAAEALGRQKAKIPSLEVNLQPYNPPRIYGDGQEVETPYREEITPGEGLQVLFFYPGPEEGQITYVIR